MTNIDAQRIKEIRNNTKEMTYYIKSIAKSFERIADALESKADMWTCPICGEKHRVDVKMCPCCGYIPQTESTGSPVGDYRDGVGAFAKESEEICGR